MFIEYIIIGDNMFLSRKKLILILFILLIIVFIFMYKDNNSTGLKKAHTLQTNGTPVSSHTIILDAGHGKPDRWGSIR